MMTCDPCNSACQNCNGNTAQNCTSCDDGKYLNSQSNTCENCNLYCKNCEGPNVDDCTAC